MGEGDGTTDGDFTFYSPIGFDDRGQMVVN